MIRSPFRKERVMGKKKTAAELAEDVKRIEQRLQEARERERQASKAEEARFNADIIKSVRQIWSALPEEDRPDWSEMGVYLLQLSKQRDDGMEAGEHSGQNNETNYEVF